MSSPFEMTDEEREAQKHVVAGKDLTPEQEIKAHDLYNRYRELSIRRQELELKQHEQMTKDIGLVIQLLALAAVVAGGMWGFYKFDHQKDVEALDRYRLMSQPYREMQLTRLVRIVDAAGTIAAQYPGDTQDPSYREAIRSFSNDFFSTPVLFLDQSVEHAGTDFALGVEHCTGEPVRGMPPQEAHPDGKCAECIRALALNLSTATRSQLARDWSQVLDPHLGGDEVDSCTNWAHQFRRKE